MTENKAIKIGKDAVGNLMFVGDGNVVIFTQNRVHEDDFIDETDDDRAGLDKEKIGPNPYKGLSAFLEQDTDRFFGRKNLTNTLWEKFRDLWEDERKIRIVNKMEGSK